MSTWWCMDCQSPVELDTHGRCGSCESEAIDTIGLKKDLMSETAEGHYQLTAALSCA
jgi:Zn finger protein HypA/HybF involved in hydrogenase expression